MRKLFFFIFLSIQWYTLVATPSTKLDTMPSVFTVGEYGKEYEALVSDCDLALFHISGQSMDTAYMHWLGVLKDIEHFAQSNKFDIRGVKIWNNIFWNADGSIEHIVYFPKRSSRNINFDQFGKMLEDYIKHAKSFLLSGGCYSHFGSASFPTHADFLLGKD